MTHWPAASQEAISIVEMQSSDDGVHDTLGTQAPFRHAGVVPEHGLPIACQAPAPVQVVGC